MKVARAGASKALSIDSFRRELSKTGLRTEKFQLEVTKPPLSVNGRRPKKERKWTPRVPPALGVAWLDSTRRERSIAVLRTEIG